MYDYNLVSRYGVILVRHLVGNILHVPRVLLRFLRGILLRVALHAARMLSKFLRACPNRPTSPASPYTSSELFPKGGYSTVFTSLAPASPEISPSETLAGSSSNVESLEPPPLAVTSVTALKLVPAAPELIQRYQRRTPTERKSNERSIKPGKLEYSEETPDAWKQTVHPEGARYFFNLDKGIFTDAALTKQNLIEINQCINLLREKERQVVPGPPSRTAHTQIVIQLDSRDRQREWQYYFVNHETRVVFWVDEFETENFTPFRDLEGVTSFSHIGYEIEYQYWFFCEQFPNSRMVSEELVTEFHGIIAHACADSTTSEASLSTLDETQLTKLLTLAPYLQSRINVMDEYAMWVIARVIGIFTRSRFYNFYGQPGARLEADLSVYAGSEVEEVDTTLFFSVMDLLLFYTPSAHIRELKGIWVDNLINYARWETFLGKLNTEWNGFTIYSTVMLAVDVSLLAVPGVDKGDPNSQSVATVAVYMSLLNVVGSLVSAVLLARQSRSQADSASGAAYYMNVMTRRTGFKALGIMYSLPFALLIWAMAFFLLALFHVIFGSSDRATLGLIGVGAILIGILTLLPVWWGRRYTEWWNLAKKLPRRVQAVRCHHDEEA